MTLGLFIFTRDLRLEDNSALNLAKSNCDYVIPCFIFNPKQIEHNKYFSLRCFSFMIDCLHDLNQKLEEHKSRLYCFHGDHKDVVNMLLQKLDIDSVYMNSDITDYAKHRSEQLAKVCHDNKCKFVETSDLFLLETPLEKTYAMFTPYYDKVMKHKIRTCKTVKKGSFYTKHIQHTVHIRDFDTIKNVKEYIGGRVEAIKKLKKIQTNYNNNEQFRTSLLSPYLKFGCLSSREVYWFIKKKFGKKLNTTFIRQLVWRDFYYQLFLNNRSLFTTTLPKIRWKDSPELFKKWCDGKTGYPLIDSAMIELKTTGVMHNRLRLVVSCFLVKILYIDWRKGELWFAKTLLDYDPILNNANWQWISATLPGSKQPWFRVISPWIQSKKFDPQCTYIKHWLPQLAKVDPKIIHKWYEKYDEKIYLKPIIDFNKRKL